MTSVSGKSIQLLVDYSSTVLYLRKEHKIKVFPNHSSGLADMVSEALFRGKAQEVWHVFPIAG
jgi:hypothetical protein